MLDTCKNIYYINSVIKSGQICYTVSTCPYTGFIGSIPVLGQLHTLQLKVYSEKN